MSSTPWRSQIARTRASSRAAARTRRWRRRSPRGSRRPRCPGPRAAARSPDPRRTRARTSSGACRTGSGSIRVGHAHHAGQPRLERLAARIARQRQHRQRRAVVAARAGDDLAPPGDQPRDLHRVLVRLGARQAEERSSSRARPAPPRPAARPRATLSGKTEVGVTQQPALGGLGQRRAACAGGRARGSRSTSCCRGPASAPPSAVVKRGALAADDLQRHGARSARSRCRRRARAWRAATGSRMRVRAGSWRGRRRHALAKTRAVARACASVMIRGGEMRIAFLPHSSTSSPRWKHRLATASRAARASPARRRSSGPGRARP